MNLMGIKWYLWVPINTFRISQSGDDASPWSTSATAHRSSSQVTCLRSITCYPSQVDTPGVLSGCMVIHSNMQTYLAWSLRGIGPHFNTRSVWFDPMLQRGCHPPNSSSPSSVSGESSFGSKVANCTPMGGHISHYS